MKRIDFLKNTILEMNSKSFEMVKGMLKKQGLSFSVLQNEDVTQEVIAEKMSDFFGFVEYKTKKDFQKLIEEYTDALEQIVERKVESEPKTQKNKPAQAVSRARKYYNKAIEIKKQKPMTFEQLADYSRIMFCLYMAILDNKKNTIDNFDFSLECLKPGEIIKNMLDETGRGLGAKKIIDPKERYSDDKCIADIAVLMMGHLLDM